MTAKLRKIVATEIATARCARSDEGTCSGRITVEHPFGRAAQARWNFIYLCWQHHLVDLNKELNRHLAYEQATDEDIRRTYPKTYNDHLQAKKYLSEKYGM